MQVVRTSPLVFGSLAVALSLFANFAQATPIMGQSSELVSSARSAEIHAVRPSTIEDFFLIGSAIDIAQFTRVVMAMAANGLILGNETAWLFRSPTQLAKLELGFSAQI